jgi:hypothetical protein
VDTLLKTPARKHKAHAQNVVFICDRLAWLPASQLSAPATTATGEQFTFLPGLYIFFLLNMFIRFSIKMDIHTKHSY